MKREMFKAAFGQWYNSNSKEKKSEDFIEAEISRIERKETEGDSVGENEAALIGKYIYIYRLSAEKTRSGTEESIIFIIYGLGKKCNVTVNDYEFESYKGCDYVIL